MGSTNATILHKVVPKVLPSSTCVHLHHNHSPSLPPSLKPFLFVRLLHSTPQANKAATSTARGRASIGMRQIYEYPRTSAQRPRVNLTEHALQLLLFETSCRRSTLAGPRLASARLCAAPAPHPEARWLHRCLEAGELSGWNCLSASWGWIMRAFLP